MYQKIYMRPSKERVPTDQDHVDAEEAERAKWARDGLTTWRDLAILGRSLTLAAWARKENDVLRVILHAAQDFVFLEWQASVQRRDIAERDRLEAQWHDIVRSRARLERVG